MKLVKRNHRVAFIQSPSTNQTFDQGDSSLSPPRQGPLKNRGLRPLPLYAVSVFLFGCSLFPIYHETRRLSVSASIREPSSPQARGAPPAKKPAQPRTSNECRYDGHCPIGLTCAAQKENNCTKIKSNRMPGICEAIPVVSNEEPSMACVEACQKELQMDEHFYHEAWPNILEEYKTSNTGRPSGCVLYYRRMRDKKEFWRDLHSFDGKSGPGDILESTKQWDEIRFRHIIRVDPVDAKNNADDRWLAYCAAPCLSDDDCSVLRNSHNPFICNAGVCQRNKTFWEPHTTSSTGELVVVTGATKDYFLGLRNLLGSLTYWGPNVKVVVYNLGGLTEAHKNYTKSRHNVLSLEWPDGIPTNFPTHFNATKTYAWKPIIIAETLVKYKLILWIDSGSTVTGPLTPALDIIKRTGIFFVKGQDSSMERNSHEKTYEWFNVSKGHFQTGPHYSGNVQGYLYPSRYFDSIVVPNAHCAFHQPCIAPASANLGNHRYDQTSLSIAAYQPKVRAPSYTEYLAAYRSQVPGMPFSNTNYRFIWTSRRGCQQYMGVRNSQNYLQNITMKIVRKRVKVDAQLGKHSNNTIQTRPG